MTVMLNDAAKDALIPYVAYVGGTHVYHGIEFYTHEILFDAFAYANTHCPSCHERNVQSASLSILYLEDKRMSFHVYPVYLVDEIERFQIDLCKID